MTAASPLPDPVRPVRAATPVRPIAALLGTMTSLQLGATIAKQLFATVGAEGTTALRLLVGAIMLGVAMRPWRLRLSRRALPALAAYGATLGAMNLLFFLAIERLPLGVAVSLQLFGPLFVAAAASRHGSDFAWIALAAAGVLLLAPAAGGSGKIALGGVLCALGSGGCWGLYIITGQKVGRQLGPRSVAVGLAIGAILILPVGLWRTHTSLFAPANLPAALLIGLFASALPFALDMVALRGMPARTYGTLTSLEPAVAALVGLVVLGEVLTLRQCAGIASVIAAALGATASRRRGALAEP